MSNSSPIERRRFKRSEFQVSARLRCADRQVRVRLIDFSLMGARVEHDGSCTTLLGEFCELHIELGPFVEIALKGTVVRVVENQIAISAEHPAELRSVT